MDDQEVIRNIQFLKNTKIKYNSNNNNLTSDNGQEEVEKSKKIMTDAKFVEAGYIIILMMLYHGYHYAIKKHLKILKQLNY